MQSQTLIAFQVLCYMSFGWLKIVSPYDPLPSLNILFITEMWFHYLHAGLSLQNPPTSNTSRVCSAYLDTLFVGGY